MSPEEIVRQLLRQAVTDGLITELKPVDQMSSGDLVGVANLLLELTTTAKKKGGD